MVSGGRIYIVVASILALVLGLLFLIVRGSGPGTGPSLDNGQEAHGIDSIRSVPGESPPREPGPSAPSPHAPPGPTPRPEPVAVEEKPVPLSEPSVGRVPGNRPITHDLQVTAFLVDKLGVPLPWTAVTVQTLSVPKTVLTRGAIRTDRDGRFQFRPPATSNMLHVWCPGLRASARKPWRPSVQAGAPLTIQLKDRALVGRLVDDGGRAPNWKGINLRLTLVPSGRSVNESDRGLPISVERRTGSFAAMITSSGDQDLVVSARGQTGIKQLLRIPNVTRSSTPLVVTVSDPRSFFGAFSLRVVDTQSMESEERLPSLEVVWNQRRVRLNLSGGAGGVLRTGPLSGGVYPLRAVAGNRISIWQRVELKPGATRSLGVLTLEDQAMLRVRPLFPDGSVDRGAKVRLFDDTNGIQIPARFTGDAQGFLGQDFFPARYRVRVVASDPRRRAPGDVVAELHPGGVHEVVVRLK